jgi:hypothetical protein
MPADKKINRSTSPRPEKEDRKHTNQQDYQQKMKNDDREIGKPRRVTYVIKDLPIY